mmetsp:Transcript_11158/g.29034  ORF Transcript_11158/g.29034 Transcript_11158/m.29034 type:complete len:166 (+) Transcript_11158:56-553(+)
MAAAQPVPRKEGFAVKRGTRSFISRFAKNKRYFILDAEGLLVYAPDSEQARSGGKHIDLFLSRIVDKSPATLEIVTEDRTYPVEFSGQQERDEWRDALLAAQGRRIEQIEQLLARLEGVLEKHASRGGTKLDQMLTGGAPPKLATRAQALDQMSQLAARLEKLAK